MHDKTCFNDDIIIPLAWSGVLIAKRSLFQNKQPSGAGGGSVFFVGRNNHRYLQDEEMREEGGTPRVAGIARAGLAFQLKQVSCFYDVPYSCHDPSVFEV